MGKNVAILKCIYIVFFFDDSALCRIVYNIAFTYETQKCGLVCVFVVIYAQCGGKSLNNNCTKDTP